MKKKNLNLAFLLIIIGVTSCTKYPDRYERNNEQLVDITQYDVKTDFTQFKNFAIVDSLNLIENNDSTKVLNSEAQNILNRICSNMTDRGFSKVTKYDSPDLGIAVSAVINYSANYFYPGWYWDTWGYYDPWYWGSYYDYSYYYPYYPMAQYSYDYGTLIIEMYDLKNAASHNKKLYVVWSSFVRGLVTGNHTQDELNRNIDQCFIQTPVF